MQDTKAKPEHYNEKVIRFQGKNKDLNQLSQQIVQYLTAEGFKTESANLPLGDNHTSAEGRVFKGHHRREQSVHHFDSRPAE